MAYKIITPKQQEILILLYRFRFLNRQQIQTLLNHKDPKRINSWLKDLTDKNIIGRHYSTKLKENTKPAIYYLMTKSKQHLINQPGVNEKLLKRVYRERLRSNRLINHCILLADYFLDLQRSITTETLHFYTKTDLSTYYYLPFNRPDAYIVKKGETTKRYFLEIIDEGTPRFMLRKRIEQYFDYFESNMWQEKTNYPFPSILFLCPNQSIKEFLHKYLNHLTNEEAQVDISFYLSLSDNIVWENALRDDEG